MIIYGLTIISSECDIQAITLKGNTEYCESYTTLCTSEKELIDIALKKAKQEFDAYEFEDGEDDNGTTLEEFYEQIRNKENICIQANSSHIEFDMFSLDMGIDVLNREDFIATKLWQKEDVKEQLRENGYKATPKQINAVIDTGVLRGLGECNDNDWALIDYAISEAANENPKLFKKAA